MDILAEVFHSRFFFPDGYVLSTYAYTLSRVAASSSILTEIGLSEVFESEPRVPRLPNLSLRLE